MPILDRIASLSATQVGIAVFAVLTLTVLLAFLIRQEVRRQRSLTKEEKEQEWWDSQI